MKKNFFYSMIIETQILKKELLFGWVNLALIGYVIQLEFMVMEHLNKALSGGTSFMLFLENLKNAYIAEKLSLLDYLYALASNTEWTLYVDDDDTASNIESSIIESSSEDEETEVEINYDDLDVQPAEPLDRDLAEQSMFIAAYKSTTANINSCKLIFKFFIFFTTFSNDNILKNYKKKTIIIVFFSFKPPPF